MLLFYTEVSLTSSVDSVCPGGTVVFTCVTDTNQLAWNFNGVNKVYNSLSQPNEPAVTNFGGLFTLKLLDTANGLESTATAKNLTINQNGASITCTDDVNEPDAGKTRMIVIGYSCI